MAQDAALRIVILGMGPFGVSSAALLLDPGADVILLDAVTRLVAPRGGLGQDADG